MAKSLISYLDKGLDEGLLLLPGWGFDPFVWDIERFNYNLFIPQTPLLDPLPHLERALEEQGIKRLSVLGWSLGARIALDAVTKLPDLFDKCILASYGAMFSRKTIENKIQEIRRDKKRGLKTFYLAIFPDTTSYKGFMRLHQKRCMEYWNENDLIAGLKYLIKKPPGKVEAKNVLFIHGSQDEICPLEGLPDISERSCQRKVVLSCGHIPFLKDDFYDLVNNFQKLC